MKDLFSATSLADTLTLTLSDGRDVLLNLSYSATDDEISEAVTRVVANMLDVFWLELLEQE